MISLASIRPAVGAAIARQTITTRDFNMVVVLMLNSGPGASGGLLVNAARPIQSLVYGISQEAVGSNQGSYVVFGGQDSQLTINPSPGITAYAIPWVPDAITVEWGAAAGQTYFVDVWASYWLNPQWNSLPAI